MTYPYGFDKNDVVSCRFTQQGELPGPLAYPAQGPSTRGGADKSSRVMGEVGHPGFVSQDATATLRTAWVYRQDGNVVSLLNQVHPELVNKGALANSRNSCDPDPVGVGLKRVATGY